MNVRICLSHGKLKLITLAGIVKIWHSWIPVSSKPSPGGSTMTTQTWHFPKWLTIPLKNGWTFSWRFNQKPWVLEFTVAEDLNEHVTYVWWNLVGERWRGSVWMGENRQLWNGSNRLDANEMTYGFCLCAEGDLCFGISTCCFGRVLCVNHVNRGSWHTLTCDIVCYCIVYATLQPHSKPLKSIMNKGC